jgi:hypothetical protein
MNWEIFWIAIGSIAALATLAWAIWEHSARKRSDKELAEIKNRGDAPFLTISDANFQMLYHKLEQHEVKVWRALQGNVLCYLRNEVDQELQKGDWVIFVIDNAGESARTIIAKLDNEEIALKQEIDFDNSQGLYFLEYAYNPENRGKKQHLTISFETKSGAQNTHTYITRHGQRLLKRINPSLPQ